MKTIVELAAMPWKKWQAFFIEDLVSISKQLDLDWKEVKQNNQTNSKKSQAIYPNKNKIASYLRKEVIKQSRKIQPE